VVSRLLLPLLLTAALAMTPHGWGAEQELTPIIGFGNPADGARLATSNACLFQVTGTRVNDGGVAARVDFELVDWPELIIRPAEASVDWSGVSALAIPVDNPTMEPIDLVIRVDDDPHADGEHHSLSGRTRVRSSDAGC
jgi:hypothetical protein